MVQIELLRRNTMKGITVLVDVDITIDSIEEFDVFIELTKKFGGEYRYGKRYC